MKNKLDILISFLFYGIGLLAFLLVDIYVVHSFTKNDIAEWAFSKSILLIIGSVCLLGYDQVFIRDTSLIHRFFKQFNLQSLVIILIVGFSLYIIKQYSASILIVLLISVYLFALISYISASYRAKFNLWKAQFATNLWRILLLISVAVCHYENINIYFLQSLFFSLCIILLLGIVNLLKPKESTFLLNNKAATRLGYSFVLTNMTLILAVYGEQFLINLKDNAEVSSHLFTYFSVFTPIALSLNGFIGFYYGPKIRKANDMTLLTYKKFSLRIWAYSIVITIISVIIGIIYMIYGLQNVLTELDYPLIYSLSILCIVRGGYISTSVCLGVFGSSISLKKSAYGMCISTCIYVCLVFFVLHTSKLTYTALLISLASVFNWTIRLIISNYYTIYNLKIKEKYGYFNL